MKRPTAKTAATISIVTLLAIGAMFLINNNPVTHAQRAEQQDAKTAARPDHRCSAHTIRGIYSYTAQGTILAGSPLPVPPGPFASLGQVTLDGEGNITEHLTNDNFNGLLLPPTNYTGTYTVGENCGGTAILVGRAPYKFTIADSGKEIYFMLDAPGTVVTGTAKKQ